MRYIVFFLFSYFIISCSLTNKKQENVLVRENVSAILPKFINNDKIQLIDSKPYKSGGFSGADNGKPNIIFDWQNDTVLYVKSALAYNDGLICTPIIHVYGQLIDLGVVLTNAEKNNDIVKGVGDYYVEWHLKGVKKSDRYVYLVNGRLTKNFDKKMAASLFKRFNVSKKYGYVVSVLDNSNKKQGLYIEELQDKETWRYYKDDVLVNSY